MQLGQSNKQLVKFMTTTTILAPASNTRIYNGSAGVNISNKIEMLSEISRKTLFIQFQLEPNATDAKMKKISIILGISFKEVQKFFQNQRKFAKMRRKKRSEIQRDVSMKARSPKELTSKDLEQKKKSSLASSGRCSSSGVSSGYSSLGPQRASFDISATNITQQFKLLETEEFEDPAIVATVKTSTPLNSIRDRIKFRQEVKAFKNLNNLSCIRPSTPIRGMKKVAEENLLVRKKNRRTLF